jgi:hypothetical protein
MNTIEAVRRVINAWGVDDQTKIKAIRLVLSESDPDKVLGVIDEIENALGALESMRAEGERH